MKEIGNRVKPSRRNGKNNEHKRNYFFFLFVVLIFLVWFVFRGRRRVVTINKGSVENQIVELFNSYPQEISQDRKGIGVRIHSSSQGFGVQFVTYASVLSHAIKSNNVFFYLYDENDGWNYENDDCKKKKLALNCYFESMGNVYYEENDKVMERLYHVLLPPVSGFYNKTDKDNEPKSIFGGFVFPEMHNWQNMFEPPSWFSISSRKWEGILSSAIFRPKKEVLEYIEKIRKNLGLLKEEPYIGIHIRHGDRTDLLSFELDDFLLAARKIKKEFGVKKIYLATDDENVKLKCSDYSSEFDFFFQTESIDDYQGFQFKKTNSETMIYNMILDMFFLSESDYFIGTQRSLFGWVASRIRIGKNKENTGENCPVWIDEPKNKYGYFNGEYKGQSCI